MLGKLPVPGRPTVWMLVEQGPIALAEGAGCLALFSPVYHFSLLSSSRRRPTNSSTCNSLVQDGYPSEVKNIYIWMDI